MVSRVKKKFPGEILFFDKNLILKELETAKSRITRWKHFPKLFWSIKLSKTYFLNFGVKNF